MPVTQNADTASVSEICTKIINDPENNIAGISSLLQANKHRGVVLLSLAKVFKMIVPLYRIRIHTNKVKHRNQDLAVTEFDRQLFKYYNAYVKEICSADTVEGYRSAAELVRSLDHFNFSDRLVAKVLLGTTKSPTIAGFCIETIVDRVRSDETGDTIFMIIEKCLDYKFSHRVVEAMVESKYLEKCVEIRREKEEYYDKESIERRKNSKSEKSGRGFFARKFLTDKKAKKEEKERLQLQKKTRQEEKQEQQPINEKNYIKTVNAMQRLYFTILKDRHVSCFESTFVCIRKYVRIIRKEFREGLYTLLVDAIKESSTQAALEGIRTVFELYKDSGYDFKRILDVLYAIVAPFNYTVSGDQFASICAAVRYMFIDVKQPKNRVVALTQRLMHSRITRYIPQLDQLIKDLEVKYDLDFLDFEMQSGVVGSLDERDIDKVANKAFYEYYLFRSMQ